MPFDSLHRPLRPVWTCAFLAPKRATDKAHGYYAGCGLGDAAARVAYVESVRRERFDSVLRLQRAAAALAQPYLVEIWAAKGRQLDAGEAQRSATAELESLLRQMESEIVAFVDESSAEFEAVALPVDAVKELLTLALRDMVERKTLGSGSYMPPLALQERFPADLRPLLFPSRATR